jgi:hypothetical protein
MNKLEIWKDISGYEGLYQVSNMGRVKSLTRKVRNRSGYRTVPSRILKNKPSKHGYYFVGLSKKNISRTKSVHVLVAKAFLSNPMKKRTVNHKFGDRTDNRSEMLEWMTYSENNKHSYDILNRKPNSKAINQFTKFGHFIKKWDSISDVKRELNINISNISQACRKLRKTAGGFKWGFCTDLENRLNNI